MAINPLVEYADDFQLIAMDQRNAGASTGPLDVVDPWASFIDDQVRSWIICPSSASSSWAAVSGVRMR